MAKVLLRASHSKSMSTQSAGSVWSIQVRSGGGVKAINSKHRHGSRNHSYSTGLWSWCEIQFLSMLNWLSKGIPLPLGAIKNQRSLVSIGNLVSLIVACIDHPAAANQSFLVSDGEALSTTHLLRCLSKALGKPARLLSLSKRLLELAASIMCKQALMQRNCGSLQVDISKNRDLLGWTPPINRNKAMRQAADHYLDKQTK